MATKYPHRKTLEKMNLPDPEKFQGISYGLEEEFYLEMSKKKNMAECSQLEEKLLTEHQNLIKLLANR